MRITDELRKYVQSWRETPNLMDDLDAGDIDGLLGDFEHIADRIDAEHESACAEAYGNGVMSVPIALDESAWVELPKDADGEPWNVGDRNEDGNDVIALKLAPDGWYVIAAGEWPYRPDSKRHYHAPTVEDVLTEFGIDWEHESDCEDRAALLKEYAKRLTLAEGEDA